MMEEPRPEFEPAVDRARPARCAAPAGELPAVAEAPCCTCGNTDYLASGKPRGLGGLNAVPTHNP